MSKQMTANDNTKLTVVWEDGERVRNYTMLRSVPDIDPMPDGTTGEVDMGRNGKWTGYAVLDTEKGKWIFHKVRELKRNQKVS
jgi:hypothetical protein